jgi:hypothetical protein
MKRMTASTLAALALASSAGLAPAAAQDAKTDVTLHNMNRATIVRALAESLDRSVALDAGFRDATVADFLATDVTGAEALDRFLAREELFSVEVAGVLVVAPDTERLRAYYRPARAAAHRVAGGGSTLTDVIFRRMTLPEILEALSRSLGRRAVFDAALEKGTRRYDLELRNVTRADALQVATLVNHVSVEESGDALVFSAEPR